MRRILQAIAVVFVGVFLAAGTVEAQGGGPGGGGPGRGPRMIERLFQDITLSDAQVAQRDSIVKVYQAQMPAFTQGTRPSPEDRQKRMEIMGKQQEAFKTILTPEQKLVFEKNTASMQRPPQE